jgi:hypothetical protein
MSHFVTNWPKRAFCRAPPTRSLPSSLVQPDADAIVMAALHTSSRYHHDPMASNPPIHLLNVIRLANSITPAIPFMLHLPPISTSDEHVHDGFSNAPPWTRVGMESARRAFFLQFDPLFHESANPVWKSTFPLKFEGRIENEIRIRPFLHHSRLV